MSYTITDAQYANIGNTVAFITTTEAGLVLISQDDNPSDWADLEAWDAGGGTIAAYTGNYDDRRETKQLANDDEFEEVLDPGFTFGIARYSAKEHYRDKWQFVYLWALEAKGPIGSFDVNGGTSNPGTNKFNSITIAAVDILGAAVNWATSNAATAEALAAQINSYTSSPNYKAASYSGKLWFWLDAVDPIDAGYAGPVWMNNNETVTVSVGGDATYNNLLNMTGGPAPTVRWPTGVDTMIATSIEGTEISLWTPYHGLYLGRECAEWYIPLIEVHQTNKMDITTLPDIEATITAFDVETPYDPYR